MDKPVIPNWFGSALDLATGGAVIGWLILEVEKVGSALIGAALFAIVMLRLYAMILQVKRQRLLLKQARASDEE